MIVLTDRRLPVGRLLHALLLAFAIGACAPGLALGADAEATPLVLGAPFGEHEGLRALDDAAGTTVLAWRVTTGEGQSIDLAAISPTAAEASPVETVAVASGAIKLSPPALAISPAGRVAVAWFEQRETAREWQYDTLALEVRERAPDGSWEGVKTLWRAPAKPAYLAENLSLALDDAGDTAVLWTTEREQAANPQPLRLLVSTRAAGGTYGAPSTLDTEATETEPAIAVAPGGEVCALWAGPWRSLSQTLYEETWHAGSAPDDDRGALDSISASESRGDQEPFGSLSLQTAGSGEELAVWLRGWPGTSGRPDLVELRGAWKPADGPFDAAQTITSPAVEAREPALALSSSGRALVAWTEIAADGSGPLLNYAIASSELPFAAGTPAAVPLGRETVLTEDRVTTTWLPGGRALVAWDSGQFEYADEVAPGAMLGPGVAIRKFQSGSEFSEQPVIAGAEAVRPVLAWDGRSPADFSASAVRYVIGANLPSFAGPSMPSASLVGKLKLAQGSVAVRVTCPEACTAAITATAYAQRLEDSESAAASAYSRLGALTHAVVALPAGGRKVARLRLVRSTLKRFCVTTRQGDDEALEVIVSVQTAHAGERRLILGEEPTSKGCR